MEIKRINSYEDTRFKQSVLNQHGCFLVDDEPYEVEIISESEAVVRGNVSENYATLIEEFRFYTPHIYIFYDVNGKIVKEYPKVQLFDVALEDIQPSQFYVDSTKVEAIKTFIYKGEDIIIQVMPYKDRYISLDGHTRLYLASVMGYLKVRAVVAESDEYIMDFVEEAIQRGITSPKDMQLLNHAEYDVKWNQYCEEYFGKQ